METRNVLFEKKYLNIIFDNRNKEYGAYQLRMEYEKNIAIALFSSILLLVIVPLSIKGYKYFFPTHQTARNIGPFDLTEVSTIIPDVIREKLETKPPKGTPPPSDAMAPMVVTDNTTEDSDTTNEELLAMNTTGPPSNGPIGVPDGEVGGAGPIDVVVVAKPDIVTPPTVLLFAEEMPEFPGGEEALLRFIKNHLEYPAREREEGISGTAIVSFVVDENGQVINVTAVRSSTRGFKSSSEEVVAQLPKFKPGRQSGKNVKVRMSVPIKFQTQ
jgi:protein TonB